MHLVNQALNDVLIRTVLLSVAAFVLAMLLTPVYTFLAYRYKFWKRQRTESTTGEALKIFTKLHANKFKRNIPTMAGMVFVLAIVIVTFFFNLDRKETWLPLAALAGGAMVGLIDDIINIRGKGKGVAGLRSSLKFLMITAIGVVLGWFFFEKLGVTGVTVPFLGEWQLGWLQQATLSILVMDLTAWPVAWRLLHLEVLVSLRLCRGMGSWPGSVLPLWVRC